eukprot:Clim_evm5s170 gene=Clim_evmTU5s170
MPLFNDFDLLPEATQDSVNVACTSCFLDSESPDCVNDLTQLCEQELFSIYSCSAAFQGDTTFLRGEAQALCSPPLFLPQQFYEQIVVAVDFILPAAVLIILRYAFKLAIPRLYPHITELKDPVKLKKVTHKLTEVVVSIVGMVLIFRFLPWHTLQWNYLESDSLNLNSDIDAILQALGVLVPLFCVLWFIEILDDAGVHWLIKLHHWLSLCLTGYVLLVSPYVNDARWSIFGRCGLALYLHTTTETPAYLVAILYRLHPNVKIWFMHFLTFLFGIIRIATFAISIVITADTIKSVAQNPNYVDVFVVVWYIMWLPSLTFIFYVNYWVTTTLYAITKRLEKKQKAGKEQSKAPEEVIVSGKSSTDEHIYQSSTDEHIYETSPPSSNLSSVCGSDDNDSDIKVSVA